MTFPSIFFKLDDGLLGGMLGNANGMAGGFSGLAPQPGPVDGGVLQPDMCGGSVDSHDAGAPKEIVSEDITFFQVGSSFVTLAEPAPYTYVSGYAAKVDAGVLAAITCGNGCSNHGNAQYGSSVGVVEPAVMAELQSVVAEYGFVKHNGRSHYVNGLPQDFGGSVRIEYASGEYISYSDNQTPVIDFRAGTRIAEILNAAIQKSRVKIPDAKKIVAVEYFEDRGKGNFTRFRLEGTRLTSEQKFDGCDTLFQDEYEVSKDALEAIRKTAASTAALGWAGLPESDSDIYKMWAEQLIFTLKDGSQAVVKGAMRMPGPSRNIIFDTKMYLQDLMK